MDSHPMAGQTVGRQGLRPGEPWARNLASDSLAYVLDHLMDHGYTPDQRRAARAEAARRLRYPEVAGRMSAAPVRLAEPGSGSDRAAGPKDTAILELAHVATELLDDMAQNSQVPGSLLQALRNKISYYRAFARTGR